MKDTVSKILLKVIDILFVYNIAGTSYGCMCGLLLLSLQDLIAEWIPQIGLIKWYGFVAFGILIFNIPPMVKKKYTDPNLEARLKYTRQILKEENFSKAEGKNIWRRLINSYYENPGDISNMNSNNPDKTSVE